ncbi:MAG: hypothetical protein JWM01_1995 [Arthrobacter sp.]|nr:hypothetical protein [Arthrobacter sp.]
MEVGRLLLPQDAAHQPGAGRAIRHSPPLNVGALTRWSHGLAIMGPASGALLEKAERGTPGKMR